MASHDDQSYKIYNLDRAVDSQANQELATNSSNRLSLVDSFRDGSTIYEMDVLKLAQGGAEGPQYDDGLLFTTCKD